MSVRLYHGDCLEIMPTLAGIDAVITDPPYGIADVWKGGNGSGWASARKQTPTRNEWDSARPPDAAFDTILGFGKPTVIWGGNYFPLPVSRGWLIWVKPERGFTLSEAELGWTNREMPMRVWEHRRSDPKRVHPTQKPIGLMTWCLEVMKIPQGATVLDTYMGSGTTGVACAMLGMNFVGIEAKEQSFCIAQKRIRDAESQGNLFTTEATP